MLAGDLNVTKTLLGDEAFSDRLFPYLYEEAGGGGLSQKKLPPKRRSWKDDLHVYSKEIIELLF
jgi:hypothetical protein